MNEIELDSGYNEGPVTLSLEMDELYDGQPGLLMYLHSTSAGTVQATTINLGIGSVEMKAGETEFRYDLCARLEAARQLRDAFTKLVSDMETVIEEGWGT